MDGTSTGSVSYTWDANGNLLSDGVNSYAGISGSRRGCRLLPARINGCTRLERSTSARAMERKNSQTFIEFLEYLLVEKCPHQEIVLVLDNASYHQSQATLAALSLFEPRVRVFWLPKYCPTLNLIERFWRHLKGLACANRLIVALEMLADRVDEIVQYQNSESHPLKISFLDNFD